jgi:hypothetical protein
MMRLPAVVVLAVFLALTGVSQCSRSAAQQPSFRAVATVDEVMDAIIIPSSQALFDAVVYSNGELIQAPKTDEDWYTLRLHALAAAEGGNLLLLPPRARDSNDWVKYSRALTDASVTAAEAAEAKDIEGLLTSGSEIYGACTACHAKYLDPPEQ